MREPFESGAAIFKAFRNNSGAVVVVVVVGRKNTLRYNAAINTSRGDVCIFCIYLYIVMAKKRKKEK